VVVVVLVTMVAVLAVPESPPLLSPDNHPMPMPTARATTAKMAITHRWFRAAGGGAVAGYS
jgi:hypothetical protein